MPPPTTSPQSHAGEEAKGGGTRRDHTTTCTKAYILAHTNPHQTLGWQPEMSQGVDMRSANGALAPLGD